MIPLYVEVDNGTDYQPRFEVNPFALYLIACGWRVGIGVYPTKPAVKRWLGSARPMHY